jgi:hypothetical protein
MYPILPISFAYFDKWKQGENGKERLERDPQERTRKKDPNHIEAMWRQKQKRFGYFHEG